MRLLPAEDSAREDHAAIRQRCDRIADEIAMGRNLLVDGPFVCHRIINVDSVDLAVGASSERPDELAVGRAHADLDVHDRWTIDGGRSELFHHSAIKVPPQEERGLRGFVAVGPIPDDVHVAADLHMHSARKIGGVCVWHGHAERNIRQAGQLGDVPLAHRESSRGIPELDDLIFDVVVDAAERTARGAVELSEQSGFLHKSFRSGIEPPQADGVIQDRRAGGLVRIISARPQQEFRPLRHPYEAGVVLQRMRRGQRRIDGLADFLAPRAVGQAHAPGAIGRRRDPVSACYVEPDPIGRHVGLLAVRQG